MERIFKINNMKFTPGKKIKKYSDQFLFNEI